MLKNKDQRDFFMMVYTQCNEHAREQPKFRDQVILFYTAVCAFYLSQMNSLPFFLFLCFSAAMIILGLICSLSVINFRSWILQYIKASETIGKILCSPQELSSFDDITSFLEKNCRPNTRPFFEKYFRVGHSIVLGFFFITLTPFAVLIYRFPSYYILFFTLAIFYIAVLFHVFFRKIDQAESMNTKTWIIRFYDIMPIVSSPSVDL